ncbi:nectin-4-like isoform X1 [Xyrichtys novacula]|nr:nectin-4-like isoform X1 [Xyrichtys novacula]
MTLPFYVMALILNIVTDALQIIGGNATAVQYGTAVLPCKLTDTSETLLQILWQRLTRGKPQKDDFLTISRTGETKFLNGKDYRFKFIGDFNDKNGTLQLSNITVMDEGRYICIFTLFPSGNHETSVPLNVLVPPITSLKENHLTLGNEEVVFATCTAAKSKPPAEVTWLTGTLAEKVKIITNSIVEDTGTTTTESMLLGVPTREISGHTVECVISNDVRSEKESLPFTIKINSPPLEVKIIERSANVFQCLSEGYPTPDFSWSRSDQSWPSSGVRTEGATLQFLSTTSDLNGLYQCKASNTHGSQQAYLKMLFTPGSCPACWTLFSLLLILNVAAVVFGYLYKTGRLPSLNLRRQQGSLNLRGEQGTPEEMQKVRIASGTSDDNQRVEEEEHEEESAATHQ